MLPLLRLVVFQCLVLGAFYVCSTATDIVQAQVQRRRASSVLDFSNNTSIAAS